MDGRAPEDFCNQMALPIDTYDMNARKTLHVDVPGFDNKIPVTRPSIDRLSAMRRYGEDYDAMRGK